MKLATWEAKRTDFNPPGKKKKKSCAEETTTTRLGFLSLHVVLRSETTPARSPFLFLGLTLAAAAAGGAGGGGGGAANGS